MMALPNISPTLKDVYQKQNVQLSEANRPPNSLASWRNHSILRAVRLEIDLKLFQDYLFASTHFLQNPLKWFQMIL